MRWDRDAKQCSTRWRYLHEAPVSVENFGKDRRFFICVALDRTYIGVAVDVPEKGVLADFAKIVGYPLEIFRRQ